jgi:DNA-directed RNA polymerase II subunit RPB2
MDSMYHFGSWNQKQDYDSFVNENNIYKLVPNLIIAQTFAKSLKGMWGIADEEDPELGKVQDLARISYIGFMSHLRRVNLPLDRSIKVTSPHKLHPQQYGIMCPFETPDGGSVGYMKNLAFLTKIASGTNTENIRNCLLDIGVVPIRYYDMPLNRDTCRVLLNGSWFGITHDPAHIIRVLRAYRRNSLINVLISVSWHIKFNEIRVLTEAGRPCRPLIIANKVANKPKWAAKSWFDLIAGSTLDLTDADKSDEFYYRNQYINPSDLPKFAGMEFDKILKTLEHNAAVIEYLDIEEEDTCLLAMEPKDVTVFHTHLEIHPSTMLSVVSANIPFCNHNQSARNVFHGAQSKQAIGMYATSFNHRFDTMSYVHHYPQRQLVGTQLSQYTNSSYMPHGFNVIAAIMTYTGFNQEDSVMINQKSIERDERW